MFDKSGKNDFSSQVLFLMVTYRYSETGKGNVTADALGDCLRACGQNPTNAQVRELAGGNRQFNFDQFLTILKRPGGFDAVGSHDEFNSAFAVTFPRSVCIVCLKG